MVFYAASRARNRRAPLTGALKLDIVFRLPPPKTVKRSGWHYFRPDLDNLEKGTMDAMTRAGIWNDDGQVALKTTRKVYSVNPGADITISEVEPFQGEHYGL